MRQSPIAVTGVGIASALGWSVDSTWSAMRSRQSGLKALTLFESPRWGHIPVGQISEPIDDRWASESRSHSFALHAGNQAWEHAGLADRDADDCGIVLGTCTGGMLESEALIAGVLRDGRAPQINVLKNHPCSSTTDCLADHLRLGGPRSTLSDACASGASAIAVACDWLSTGRATRVLAGGVDVLTRLTLNGFGSLFVLDRQGCRPFDADRAGMSLGEGAGMLALEREDAAEARGAPILGYIAGHACTCDAYHASGPEPSGRGVRDAMASALDRAAIKPSQIGYINPHGSGTRHNDLAEANAIRNIFNRTLPPISSTKRFFGHTLGAAGAIEAIVCLLALQTRQLPPNLGLRQADSELGVQPLTQWVRTTIVAAMSNSLGFGGINVSLVLTRGPNASSV